MSQTEPAPPAAQDGPDPAGDAGTPSTPRRWVWPAVAALVVAVIGVVGGLGGFAQQIRQYQTLGAGAPVTTGPYVLTFTKATAQRQPATSYRQGSVKVLISGTGRTTGEESITPSVGSTGMFLAYDKATNNTQDAAGQRLADGGPSSFTPGLPDIAYQVEFSFPADFTPGEEITIGVIEQEFGSNALIQTDDEEKRWHNDRDHGYQVSVPVTVLPDAKN